MKETLILIMIFCVGNYIFCTIFQNKNIRKQVAEIWFLTESHTQFNHKKVLLRLINDFINTVYCKNNRINIAKLVLVVLISNCFLVVYFFQMDSLGFSLFKLLNQPLRGAENNVAMLAFPVLVSCLMFSMLVVEYLSCTLTKILVGVAKKKNSYKFIILDISILIVLFILPFIVFQSSHNVTSLTSNFGAEYLLLHIYEFFCGTQGVGNTCPGPTSWWSVLSLYLTPYINILFLVVEYLSGNTKNFILLITPTFSICLPTIIGLSSIFIVYNKRFLKFTSSMVIKFESLQFNHIKTGSLIIYGFAAGFLGIYL